MIPIAVVSIEVRAHERAQVSPRFAGAAVHRRDRVH
jgi:hypothetical protein